MGDGGELERVLDDVFGIKVTVRYVAKSKLRQNFAVVVVVVVHFVFVWFHESDEI